MGNIRNNLFTGLESKEFRKLNASVAKPIPLWSFMPIVVNKKRNRKENIPIATMLAITSSYQTVLAITDAIVPVKVPREDGSRMNRQRHFKYDKGKPWCDVIDSRSPLAFMNHGHLHRVLKENNQQIKKVLKTKPPKELQDMMAGFRLIRCYRDTDPQKPRLWRQRWEVYKIDETKDKDTGNGKTPLVDLKRALELEMTLQCPPIFEMRPNGFIPQLMRDLSVFLGAPKPFQSETTVAYRYKLWKASETAEQFNVMFQQEEEQRREAIIAANENVFVKPTPMRESMEAEGGPLRKEQEQHLEPEPEPPSITPDEPIGTFGCATHEPVQQEHTTALIEEVSTEEACLIEEDEDAPPCGW